MSLFLRAVSYTHLNAVELDKIDAEAKRRGKKQKLLLRVTPGIDPHTHEAINTGRVDSKFGVAIETGQALELVKHALSLDVYKRQVYDVNHIYSA